MTRALPQVIERCAQVNNRAMCLEHCRFSSRKTAPPPVASTISFKPGESAQDTVASRVARNPLPFDLENHRNLDAGAPLNFVIAVVERLAEMFSKQASDRSLAGAHQPDEKDVSWNEVAELRLARRRHAEIVT